MPGRYRPSYPWSGSQASKEWGGSEPSACKLSLGSLCKSYSILLSSVWWAIFTAACSAFIPRPVFSAIWSCCGLGDMQWSGCVTMRRRLGVQTLSNDFQPVLLFSVPSAPTLLETADTTKSWATEPVGVLSADRAAPCLSSQWASDSASHLQVSSYSSFCVQAPPHLSSLCSSVQYRILLLSFRGVSRRSWSKSLCVVCT